MPVNKQSWKAPLRLGKRGFLRFLEVLEARGAKTSLDTSLGPVFIIGAPRSGSTLLYQVMLHAFQFYYFRNIHNIFYTNPSLVEKYLGRFFQSQQTNFSSQYGRVKGLSAPSESGAYWRRFFPDSMAYVTQSDVDSGVMSTMKYSLAQFQNQSDKPLLVKNLPIGLRLDVILKYIPNAVFIVVKRDLENNAHAVLRARYKNTGAYDGKWWSLSPSRAEEIKNKPSAEQAVEHIVNIHEDIDRYITLDNQDKFITVEYESLCNSPNQAMNTIYQFLNNNISIVKGNGVELEKFQIQKKFVAEFETEIREYIKKHG